MNTEHKLNSYSYYLLESQIAQAPTLPEHNAKLLILTKEGNNYNYQNKKFIDLPELLDPKDVLFFNNTKVYKARLELNEVPVLRSTCHKTTVTGEIFVYKIWWKHRFECISSDDKNFKPGSKIFFNNEITLNSIELTPNGIIFEIKEMEILDFLKEYGQMPLPPYVEYHKEKEKWYQTYFAKNTGSVAAPTASLHFTKELKDWLKNKWINGEYTTLHVGLGTFRPVHSQDIRQHKIHPEEVIINMDLFTRIQHYKNDSQNIIAVWTTVTRTLESMPYVYFLLKKQWLVDNEYWNKIIKNIDEDQTNKYIQNIKVEWSNISFETKLFIYPDFQYKVIDQLITNFHLPQSSLLMLVSAFMGRENLLQAYDHAINTGYKFYSFGDWMWIKSWL